MNNKDNNYLKTEKIRILECNNAVILPQIESSENFPMWGLGGVCDNNNEFIQSSFYDGGWGTFGGPYSYEQEQYFDEDVIYIGLFLSHWGHFLIDMTSRLWAVSQLIENYPTIKIAYLGEEEPSGNNLRFLELIGINKEQLIHISVPTRFRKVYVPEQGFKSCEWYTLEHLQMLNLVVSNALTGNIDCSKYKGLNKIYFSRRSFSKAVSSEFGEEYFESVFVNNGFTAIAPEQLTLDEQIYIWNNADEIICVNGSIPLNVMFCCNKKIKLTILNKTSIPHDNPIILLKMRKIEATFLNVFLEPLKRYPKSLGEGPYLFWPTEEFDNYIKKRSFTSCMSRDDIKKYFSKQRIRYFLYIVGLRRRIRKILIRITPAFIKNLRKQLMH